MFAFLHSLFDTSNGTKIRPVSFLNMRLFHAVIYSCCFIYFDQEWQSQKACCKEEFATCVAEKERREANENFVKLSLHIVFSTMSTTTADSQHVILTSATAVTSDKHI